MKRYSWSIFFTLTLLMISIASYLVQIIIFHDSRNTFFYMLQDFAFVPIQVLLVTLIINELLRRREKSVLQNKLNMVIGAFYSEMGTSLLKMFSRCDVNTSQMLTHVMIGEYWTDKQFSEAKKGITTHNYSIHCNDEQLVDLQNFLFEQRLFLLSLLANPNLLEHDTFTDLLWSISHLTEELVCRTDIKTLPQSDRDHLAGDIRRAYSLLAVEWLSYVGHLRNDYPYIYSLTTRMNPFITDASPIIN